jgi:hypothetical protein
MAKQTINMGTPPAGTDGDTVRAGFTKVNANFDELYLREQGKLTKSIAGGAGTVALSAAEALNGFIDLTGAITGNKIVTVPAAPAMTWTVRNATSGNFSVTFKTAAGAGVVIPQGITQLLASDGVNVVSAVGQLLDVRVFTSSATYTPTPGTGFVVLEMVGGGGGGAGSPPTNGSQFGAAGGGGAGGYVRLLLRKNFAGKAVVVGAAGGGQTNGNGFAGGSTTFGGTLIAAGGSGGATGPVTTGAALVGGGQGGGYNYPDLASTYNGVALAAACGNTGGVSFAIASQNLAVSGQGGASVLGNGSSIYDGNPATVGGGGGGGVAGPNAGGGAAGKPGGPGIAIVYEYA